MQHSITEIIGFHLPAEPYGGFSNWYPSNFCYAGKDYNCAEQYMMAQKVVLGGRYDLYDYIMDTADPEEMKFYAGKKCFHEFVQIQPYWDAHCYHIVKRGVRAKFMQNPTLLQELLATGDALLCECAGQDRIWGIGINLHDDNWHDVSNWRGSNYLGRILMEIRAEFRFEGNIRYYDYRTMPAISALTMKTGTLKRHPKYYPAVHIYADQLNNSDRASFYDLSVAAIEDMIVENMGGGLPIAGFFEMKQEICENVFGLHPSLFSPLTIYLPLLESDSLGRWIIDNNDGSSEHPVQMPFVGYSKLASQLMYAILDFRKEHLDMTQDPYYLVLQSAGIEWNSESMRNTDVSTLDGQTILALLIGAVQADKFCEGAFLGFLKEGIIQKWLKRLSDIDGGK